MKKSREHACSLIVWQARMADVDCLPVLLKTFHQ